MATIDPNDTQTPDLDSDEFTDPNNEHRINISRDQIRSIEGKAKRVDTAEAENAQLKRDLAFVDAGLDRTDPKIGYFMKGYDGETTPEAIRTAAAEAGFIASPSGDVSQEELDAQARIQEASAGAQQSTGSGIPLEDAIAAAQTPEELMEVMRAAGLPTSNDQQ